MRKLYIFAGRSRNLHTKICVYMLNRVYSSVIWGRKTS